jgi:hypothetical protein
MSARPALRSLPLPRARLCGLLVVVALGAGPRAGHAAPPLVVLLVDEPAGVLAARLGAEIGTLGFEVSARKAPVGPPNPIELEDAARAAQAVAAIQIARARDGFDAWIVDRVTGKTVLRRVGALGDKDESLIALRAVELLRGSLIEIRVAQRPVGEIAAPAAVEALVASELPPPPSRVRLLVAPAAAASPGGVGVAGLLALGLRGRLGERLGLALDVALPLLTPRVAGPEGSSEVAPYVGTLGAERSFASPGTSGLAAHLAGGLGVLGLGYVGAAASSAYRGTTDRTLAALAFGRVGVSAGLRPWLRASASLLLAAAGPWPEVRFQGRHVADYGLPLALAAVGLEVAPP